MKQLLALITITIFCIHPNVLAQPRGGKPPMGEHQPKGASDNNDDIIYNIPQIPNASLEQRLQLSEILTKEHEKVSAQIQKRVILEQEMEKTIETDKDPKKTEKGKEKIAKINQAIQKIENENDAKIRKILTDEQYQFFIENKKDIKFGKRPKPKNSGMPNEQAPQKSQHNRTEADMSDPFQ